MPSRRITLPLVQSDDPLDALQSQPLQQLSRSCTVGDANHRGLLHLTATLAQHAVDSCLPPAARSVPSDCLAELKRWCVSPFAFPSRALVDRAVLATAAAEAAAEEAVTQMLALSPSAAAGPMQQHAHHVIIRHAKIATYYAAGAVVLSLDALSRPQDAIAVPTQIAGALAHKATWLACARSGTLQREAWDQASWFSERGQGTHNSDELAVQLFHEFVGVTWKAQRDAHASHLFAFVEWALLR